MRRFILSLILLASILALAAPAHAQEPTPPAPAGDQAVLERANAVLTRADEVAALARTTAEQNSSTINLIEKLVWGIGIMIVIAAAFLGLYGFSTQRGFQETLSTFRAEQDRMSRLREEMAQKVQEIEAIRKELSGINQTVTQEFTAAKQAIVLLGMGNRLFEENKRDEAIDVYREARRLQPDNPEINFHLGRAYSNAGDYADAIESLEKAVFAQPKYPEALMELGLTYRRHAERAASAEERLAEYRLAERYLLQAVNLRSDYVDALSALGGLYRREGKYKEALEYYKKANNVDPNSSYPLNNVASLAWYLGQVPLAKDAFERVEKVATERIQSGMKEGFWDLYDRALARLALGKCDEAKADHADAISRTPEEENFRSVLDNLYFLSRAETPMPGLDEFIEMIEERLPPE